MGVIRRLSRILAALLAGNFVAVNALLAGKVLSDATNLYHYSHWDYWGGPIVGYSLMVTISTVEFFMLSLIPALVVLIFTETLRIRSRWFYVAMAGLAAAVLDIACTSIDGLVGARSFCVAPSASELLIVTVAGVAAGFVFWRVAGFRSGDWSVRTATLPSV